MLVDTFASEICSPPLLWVQNHDPRVMDFVDISAEESNGNTLNDDTSSNFSSIEAVSLNSDSVDAL
jgi:hypothetical protein